MNIFRFAQRLHCSAWQNIFLNKSPWHNLLHSVESIKKAPTKWGFFYIDNVDFRSYIAVAHAMRLHQMFQSQHGLETQRSEHL